MKYAEEVEMPAAVAALLQIIRLSANSKPLYHNKHLSRFWSLFSMKRFFAYVLAVLSFAAGTFGQDIKPSPKPTPTPDDDVVKISTSLIQIDVSVTDPKGKPVTDLKADEIEIYENGEKQKISNFSFVSSQKETTQKTTGNDARGIPIPQGTLRPEQIRRTIALVVDDLSLSFESAYQTRRSLKKFVDEQMQDGDLVAIIRTGAGIGALQQFTSDKRILYAAIEKVKWNPNGSGGVGAFAPIEPTPETDAESTDTEEDPAVPSGAGQSLDDFRSSVFATGTLGALKYIVTGMSQLPGRKSVIMFSDGFKLFETDDAGMQTAGRVLEFLQQLVDLANRSSVVFYTVDARGLAYSGLTASDSPSETSGEALTSQLQTRSAQLRDTQEGLDFLAYETGGFSTKNNNDLSGGVKRVLDDQSYYLVAYEPDTDTFDAAKRKYNQLSVRVLRKGVTVRYRSGFFNVADKPGAPTPTAALTPTAQLESALISPFAVSGISLRLNALFGNDVKNGSFVRSLIHINANGLKFTDEKDGTKKAVFDVLAMSFGDNGQIVDQLAKGYTITAKPQDMKRLLENGFVYSFTFPIKKPGAFQFRVALRDFQSGKVGSANQFVEVPNLKKDVMAVSGIVLESLTESEWEKGNDPLSSVGSRGDSRISTALRRVKLGTILRYGYEIYNAKLNSARQPQITTKVRVFRDGKLVLDGKQTPLDPTVQTDMARLKCAGAIVLGGKLLPGDYVLQVIVDQSKLRPSQPLATQFVQFEVVE